MPTELYSTGLVSTGFPSFLISITECHLNVGGLVTPQQLESLMMSFVCDTNRTHSVINTKMSTLCQWTTVSVSSLSGFKKGGLILVKKLRS